MKKLFTNYKTLLLVIVALVSATTASAWSVRLSDEHKVSGYTMKAFYNLSSNASGIMPTEGDLRYRDANNGLFNFGGGDRSAGLNISVAKDDIIVFDFYDTQTRSVTVNSVTNGSKVEALSGTYPTFTISAAAEKINVNIGRGGCILSIVVMEKDQSAATADYTINYKLGDTTVKQVTGNTTVGSTVNADASFVKDDVKYIATSSTLSMTIGSSTNTLDVEVRKAVSYNYTVVAENKGTALSTIASGSVLEGDAVTVPYSQYLLLDGILYEGPKGSSDWYRTTFTPNADNFIQNITYTATSTQDVVFFTEVEDLAGVTKTEHTSRASNGYIAHTGGVDNFKEVTTLAPGVYKIYVRGINGNSSLRTCYFSVADKKVFTFANPNGTDNKSISLVIPVYSESTLKFSSEGSSASGVDWFYVVKTGEAPAGPTLNGSGYATFSESVHVQITGAKVYKGKLEGTTLTCTEIESGLVPAGTGVILCGEAGATVTVTNVAEAPAIEDNDIIATTMADTDIRAVETNAFVLSGNTFRKYAGEAFAPNKAYILYSEVTEGKLTLVFNDDATAAAVVEADAVVAPAKYVNAKGQLIIGGKYNALGQQMK